MKALVYTDTNQVIYRDEPDPVPATGDVVVKVEATGICGSDMHAYLGHDPRRVPPLVLGHEASGTIAEGTRAGERVVLNPLITCGHCPPCLSGRSNLRTIVSNAAVTKSAWSVACSADNCAATIRAASWVSPLFIMASDWCGTMLSLRR